MTSPTPETEVGYLQVAAQATKAASAGLTVFADDAPATPESDYRAVKTISVKLGLGGSFQSQNGRAYLLAFETPAPGADAYDAVAAATATASCTKLISRIDRGWTETTDEGQLRRFVAIHAKSDEEFELLLRSLPSRAATSGDETLASLAFAKRATIAPSRTTVGEFKPTAGTAGQPAFLTGSELYGLAVILDEASDSRDRLARSWYDIRDHDGHTSRVRDQFNRRQQYPDVKKTLEENGWAATTGSDFSTTFTKGDEVGELIKSNLVFVNQGDGTATLKDGAQAFRPFDLLVGSMKKGGPDGTRDVPLATAERVAQWLVEKRIVTAEAQVFSARGTIPSINTDQPTLSVIGSYVEAIGMGRSRSDASAPLAFNRTINGESEAVISIGPSGEIMRWAGPKAEGLLIASAQFAKIKVDKEGDEFIAEYRHSVPPTVVGGVMTSLVAPGVLNALEYVATEPIITKEGHVVSAHGYDMDAQAYISLPYRERAKWKADYIVPAKPTLEEVQAAYKYLDTEVFSDFPFLAPSDRARAMLYLLTCVGRHLTNGSIGFFFNAPTRGTGKSLLAGICRLLAQGSPASFGFHFGLSQDSETEKGITTLLLEGGTYLHCDEVPMGASLESKVITALITAIDGDNSLRILGGNDRVKCTGLIVTACGSNVDIGGDLNRRMLNITLAVPKGVSVLGRKGFRHQSLVTFVNQNRPRLLAAAHTILLFGLQSQPAHEISGMAMNHDWPQKILAAASHLRMGEKSVAEVALDGWLAEVEDQDHIGQSWGELLHHLWIMTAGEPKTAGELVLASLTRRKGDKAPELPTELVGTQHATNASFKWTKEFRRINNTPIPYDGSVFTLSRRAEKKDNTLAFDIVCHTDEKLILPGRDRHAEHVVVRDPEFP